MCNVENEVTLPVQVHRSAGEQTPASPGERQRKSNRLHLQTGGAPA